jgi:hypothetical protein
MNQSITHQWFYSAQSLIRQHITLCLMFLLYSSMISTSAMAQTALIHGGDYANTSSNAPIAPPLLCNTTTEESGPASDEVKDVFVPQSTVTAILCMVSGLLMILMGFSDAWRDHLKDCMFNFSIGLIGVYILAIATAPFDGSEADSTKKITYIAASSIIGAIAAGLFTL